MLVIVCVCGQKPRRWGGVGGAPQKKGPKKGQMPKKFGRCGIWMFLRLAPEKYGGGPYVWVLEEMEGAGAARCVRYGGQTTTDNDAVCVRCVYGRDSGGGSDVM